MYDFNFQKAVYTLPAQSINLFLKTGKDITNSMCVSFWNQWLCHTGERKGLISYKHKWLRERLCGQLTKIHRNTINTF